MHSRAADLLASLRTADPRLTLAERDVRRLAPAVAAWLERGTHPDAVRAALTTGLPPDRLHSPAAFLAYRLTTLLPRPSPPSAKAAHPRPHSRPATPATEPSAPEPRATAGTAAPPSQSPHTRTKERPRG